MENITSTVKLFAHYTSLFCVANDPNITTNELNEELEFISGWTYKFEMPFNPDKNKQTQEVIISRKLSKTMSQVMT